MTEGLGEAVGEYSMCLHVSKGEEENWHYQLIAAKVLRSHQRTRRNKNKISFQEKKNNKEVISFSFIFCSTILDSVDDLIREAEREAYYSVLRAFRAGLRKELRISEDDNRNFLRSLNNDGTLISICLTFTYSCTCSMPAPRNAPAANSVLSRDVAFSHFFVFRFDFNDWKNTDLSLCALRTQFEVVY
ncbi:hypothetical protein JHK82_053638 [Glycine max]|nr:hypothetical protein JHK86_053487 [Glycine max]KAG4927947.1 hypothetical protein JHK85_054433 [Glycine max]KAG5083470.1 hypothetical protein JHK84_053508 [Glycine max]KAG5086241.1 hypothetical protein JHK82_053638 [Glycine max]